MDDGQRDVDSIVYALLIVVFIGLIILLFPDEIARLSAEGDRFVRSLLRPQPRST